MDGVRTIDFMGASLRVDGDGFVPMSDLCASDPRGKMLRYIIINYSREFPDRMSVRRTRARGRESRVWVSLSDYILWTDGFYRYDRRDVRGTEISLEDISSLAAPVASPFFTAYRSVLRDRLTDGIRSLNYTRGNARRNMLVFLVYSGMGGLGGFTMEETALLFGITRERVRQIFLKIVWLLREKFLYDSFFEGFEDCCLFDDGLEF